MVGEKGTNMVPAADMRTPWGNLEELRDRRLPPGPGGSAAARARNQRERLYAATVAAIARQGYASVRVADILRLAGVSRATFYQHFRDKGHCFRETVQTLLTGGLEEIKRALLVPAGWEERAEAALRAFIELSVRQPAAARVCLIDAYTAGADGAEPVEEALQRASGMAHAVLRRLPHHTETPPELARATIGGLHRVLYNHLHRDEADRLQGEVEELMQWATCFPAASLNAARRHARRPAPGREWEPERSRGSDPHERIVRGFAAAVGERGYATTTIGQIAAKTSISQSTFYEHFRDKEDAMAAALDLSGAQLLAAALPAARREQEWPVALRRALGGLLRYLSAEPHFARLRAVEVFAAGPEAVALRDAAFEQVLAELLPAEAREEAGPLAIEASIGAVYALIYDGVRAGRSEELPDLAPLASYVILCPLLGADEAARIASEARR